ncbi:eukaryotic-like serine/threonine-protein kinase [Gammaproteobacteria bacterium]
MSKPRYTDWHPIGEGASAVVFKVFDQELQRLVAIKLLKHECAEHPDFMESLRQEVRISHDIYHRDICPIYEIYRGPCPHEMSSAQGVCIGIVMELIDGGCELKKWIKDNSNQLRDTASERLDLLRKVAAALVTAHAHIVHRDLKPANILLRQGNVGQPVIMDLGIALLGAQDRGQVAGTPRYMAPEQFTEPTRVDQRTDLFALGVMAYEMFTGKTPPTSLWDVMRTGKPPRPRREDIPRPSSYCAGLPPSLDEIIIRLMAYEPEDRPGSAAEVLQLLESVPAPPWPLSVDTDGVALEWISVPGGRYFIGASPSDRSANENEKPRREIEISPFQMTACPITNRNYRDFLQRTNHRRPPFLETMGLGHDDHPVVGVSWDDARDFARWVGGDLPSEAQWEYAARSRQRVAQGSVYPWGSDPPTAVFANIGTGARVTSAVTAYPLGRNALGFYDLCGNVWEWCLDVWSGKYYDSLSKGVRDPVNSEPGEERTLRGGSYDSLPSQGRCTARFYAPKGSQWPAVGFRVVKPG